MRNSLRFEFVSYSPTYADYLTALETPSLLLPYVLTTPAKGPYLNDVYTERGGGGYPNADVVREVAWT